MSTTSSTPTAPPSTSAPHRVDFRSLVRDLGATLRCRIELRQLSARDQARVQGGIGPLCCATFLKDFESVSIRMAKDQDLPLNPLQISGACGRLMCCLKYEHPLYEQFRQSAPTIGSRVDAPEGPGRVVGHNVPADTVLVRLDDGGRRCACPRASVCGSRQAYEASPAARSPGGRLTFERRSVCFRPEAFTGIAGLPRWIAAADRSPPIMDVEPDRHRGRVGSRGSGPRLPPSRHPRGSRRTRSSRDGG